MIIGFVGRVIFSGSFRFATSIVEVLKAIIFEKDLIASLIWKSW